jgi:transposase
MDWARTGGAMYRRAAGQPLKQCRRVATRYEKLAANYLAMLTLAAIRLWLNPQGRAKTTRASPRGAP